MVQSVGSRWAEAAHKRPEKMEKQKEFVLKQIETTIIFYLKRTKSTAGNQNKQP